MTLAGNRSGVGKALAVIAGNGLGQIVALASVPVISRLYGVDAIGLYGLFSTTVASITVIASLCLDQAILLARDPREAVALQWASALTAAAFAVLVGAMLLATEPWLTTTKLRPIIPYLPVLPVSLLVSALLQCGIQAVTQTRNFNAMSKAFLLRSGGTAVLQIVLAVVSRGAASLIAGQTAAQLSALLILLRRGRASRPAWSEIRAAVSQHRKCPLYLAPRLAIASLGDVALVGMIGAGFDAREVGLFWMSQRLLQVPSAFIDVPVRQLFVAAGLQEREQTGSINRVLLSSLAALLLAGLSAIPFIHLFGGYAVHWVLGAEWASVVPMAEIMVIGWAFEFASIPFSGAVLLLDVQGEFFIYEVVSRGGKLAAIALACARGDLLLGLEGVAAASAISVVAFSIFLLLRASRQASPALSANDATFSRQQTGVYQP